jgi:hypothetical protein
MVFLRSWNTRSATGQRVERLVVAIVLAVPAVLGMMQMLRERYIAAGPVGAGLAMMGLLPSRA